MGSRVELFEQIRRVYELRGYDVGGRAIERRSYPNCAEP